MIQDINQPYFESIISGLKQLDIDGESTQELIQQIGMEEQMLSQLIMSMPIDKVEYYFNMRRINDNLPTLPKKEKKEKKPNNTYIDARGMKWIIQKEFIQGKRGIYVYWIGDSIDGRVGFRGNLKRDVISQIKNKFGEFGK